MPGWLNWFRKREVPAAASEPALRGQSATRRVKNYASLAGYVYEYTFEGYRDGNAAREYHFAVTPSNKQTTTLVIALNQASYAEWERNTGRTLAEQERYALAKLALFAAFDEADTPAAMPQRVEPDATALELLIERLDL